MKFFKVHLPHFTLLIFVSLIVTSTLLYFFPPTLKTKPLVSPLGDLVSPIAEFLGINTAKPNKVVYGFLPYWNISEEDNLRYNLLTHVAYFGLDYKPDGTINTLDEDRNQEPGWHKLSSGITSQVFRKTKSHQGKTIIVMRAMTQDLIESIVNNKNHRQNLIDSTLNVFGSKNFDGINIDFEYAGTPDQNTKNNFSLLVKDLSLACKKKNPSCEMSIDVFADSAVNNRLWDYAQITRHLDYVIIMAYDYYRASSTQAGPVAPLRGVCSDFQTDRPTCLTYDVARAIADFTKVVPAEKIILGVPYYGYQWQTASNSFLSNTYEGSGSTATYKRVQDLLWDAQLENKNKVLGLQTHWNDTTLTPWLTYKETDGSLTQIHYEDERSLGLKYDLVNQSNIAGIAIWALGYDGDWPNLWNLLEEKFVR